ncbi:hydroxypyruvate reductase [Planctomycetaceae bacterium SCGC AG-212-D15]|nr:hydroxypyruvate reductase [Planctomycetaceae bacterium SCGC AG-212-D15]
MRPALREQARVIWDAAVDAVRPAELLRAAVADLRPRLTSAKRILVVGAGKASGAMAAALEEALPDLLPRIQGVINVPDSAVRPLRAIRLHAARPAGSNHPTEAGVHGAKEMLELVASAGPDDIVLCLISGGGSALLPAPAEGISLADKQHVTRLLHACGATINEMNLVRKHLSRIKGGHLVRGFRGRHLYSLIISDVIGDPLDVIASGPTAADPTTFADALQVLERHGQIGATPSAVIDYLRRGVAGEHPETLKSLPTNVSNLVIGNNARALTAAEAKAVELGFRVLNLGSFLEGETSQVAVALSGIVRSIRGDAWPLSPPVCLLSGGETTVTLAADHGAGGRNQEFVLAALAYLGREGLRDVVVLSGGTDGEDGPTDAAGAIADGGTLTRAEKHGLTPAPFLARNDAYSYFAATGDLLKTGLTETNVMDVRVMLIG